MNSRQSLLLALLPTALVGAFLLGRLTAPAPAPPPAEAASPDTATFVPQFKDPSEAAAAESSAQQQPGPDGDVAPDAPLSPTPDLDAKIAQAEKSGNKKAISAAYTERGATRMYDARAGRRIKYRAALDDFRKAVAADPTNESAKSSKETIEAIYRSLHMSIPGEAS